MALYDADYNLLVLLLPVDANPCCPFQLVVMWSSHVGFLSSTYR